MQLYYDYLMIVGLVLLNLIYLYILLTKQDTDFRHRNFVIQEDTKANFDLFLSQLDMSSSHRKDDDATDHRAYDDFNARPPSGKEYTILDRDDDFFLTSSSYQKKKRGTPPPNQPSPEVICKAGFVKIRSEYNYKYMWMLSDAQNNLYMDSSATFETSDHLTAFEVTPVSKSCSEGGWIVMKAPNSDLFVYMAGPHLNETGYEWMLRAGTSEMSLALAREEYWFLFEKAGYLLNKGSMAFVNNIAIDSSFVVRGHTEEGDRTAPAYREYGARMEFLFVERDAIQRSIAEERREVKLAAEQDEELVTRIRGFPPSSEKRVISFGLYGDHKRYTNGAIRNAELRDRYFPGWVCRFYVTQDVPKEVVEKLRALGSEIESIPPGSGYAAGMFYRFKVATDPTIDRFIVRDADSRLNARDRLAVEEWIESGSPVHVIRDHVNHCGRPMNGGLWGAVKGALPFMEESLKSWSSKNAYADDLNFLQAEVWPKVKSAHVAHDSYCCDRFRHTRPFPSRRPENYQHVGQVFDGADRPRMSDIDGFIRGVPVPSKCRKEPEWIYG